MTALREGAIMSINKKIEVAYFMSTSFDVAGTEDEEEKGKTPKEEMSCKSSLGHTVKSRMTVI